MARIRVVRVLVYEGEEEHVRGTVERGMVPAYGVKVIGQLSIKSAVESSGERMELKELKELIQIATEAE